nr:MAG TPA: hypothetical protein [Bacteriophage sp.]
MRVEITPRLISICRGVSAPSVTLSTRVGSSETGSPLSPASRRYLSVLANRPAAVL